MTLEAGTKYPEMTAAQDGYRVAIYRRFALLDPGTSGMPSLFLERAENNGQVPVIEFSVRGDSLPPHLQALIDEIYRGRKFASFRVVADRSRLALVASNPDGTKAGYYSRGQDGGAYTGHEITFDVGTATCAVAKISGATLQPYDSFIVNSRQVETQALEPQAIEEFASLIGHNEATSKVAIYPLQHPDLPSSFRNGSPSF